MPISLTAAIGEPIQSETDVTEQPRRAWQRWTFMATRRQESDCSDIFTTMLGLLSRRCAALHEPIALHARGAQAPACLALIGQMAITQEQCYTTCESQQADLTSTPCEPDQPPIQQHRLHSIQSALQSSPSSPSASTGTAACQHTIQWIGINSQTSYSLASTGLPCRDTWNRTASASHAASHATMPHAFTPGSMRHATTLTRPGVPNPRPEVEAAMSTGRGGHIARMITFTQTLQELDQVLHKYQDSLQNVHWAAAALQVEKLYRQERASPFGLRVKSIATRIETAATAHAPRMAIIHLAPLLRGLTGASHSLAPSSLTALAAVLIARDCAQLKLASDVQWKHLVWGFSMQGYSNPVFWQQLASVCVGLMPRWEPNRTASVLKNMTMMGVRSDTLMQAAMQRLVEKAEDLQPYPLTDALYAMAAPKATTPPPGTHTTSTPEEPGSTTAAGGLSLRERCVSALAQRGLAQLPRFDPKCCALFLSSLVRLDAASTDIAEQVISAVLHSPSNQLHPLYVLKLLNACTAAGLRAAHTTDGLVALALPLLPAADAGLRQQLLDAALKSVDGAGELEMVKHLSRTVAEMKA